MIDLNLNNKQPKGLFAINSILISLILLDITLSIVAFFFPQLWFTIFHDTEYIDPQGFLRRCAANWTAFALFQTLALIKWKERPHWLVLVAGIRLSDIFTDWTYLYFSQNITWFGRVSLLAVSPMNLYIGWFLLKSFTSLEKRSQQVL